MSIVARDENSNLVPIRKGNAIGGKRSISGADLTADTWYRLLPAANTGALVSGNDLELNIGTLRSDILEIEGWNLLILNDGYYQANSIKRHEGNVVTLNKRIDYITGLNDAGLASAIEYVMYPKLVNPIGINYKVGPSEDMQIGIIKGDVYNPAATDIKGLDDITAGEMLMLNFTRIDRVFYRFPTVDSSTTYVFSWGEHYRG